MPSLVLLKPWFMQHGKSAGGRVLSRDHYLGDRCEKAAETAEDEMAKVFITGSSDGLGLMTYATAAPWNTVPP
jgi:hypothetical protein